MAKHVVHAGIRVPQGTANFTVNWYTRRRLISIVHSLACWAAASLAAACIIGPRCFSLQVMKIGAEALWSKCPEYSLLFCGLVMANFLPSYYTS